jgi:hypothetical protein
VHPQRQSGESVETTAAVAESVTDWLLYPEDEFQEVLLSALCVVGGKSLLHIQ